MYGLTKKQKLKFILEKVSELNISAYEIAKKTTLTEAGVSRILNGTSKNPQENSLNAILLFLEGKVLESNLPKNNSQNLVNEPNREEYIIESSNYMKELLKCQNESVNMMKHIAHLQNLLRNKKISFEDYFEKIEDLDK